MTHFIIPTSDSVYIACEGGFSQGEMTTAWREVQKVLAEKGWKNVLVDIKALQSNPDTAQLFDLAKLFWQNFPESGRIALVVRWDQSRFAKLLETVIRSVGIYLTVFVSETQAEAWILGDSRDKHQPPALKGTSPCRVS